MDLKNIIIVGGAGFIGTKLTEELLSRGYFVTILDIAPSKLSNQNLKFIKSNPAVDGIDKEIIENCDGIINLAGSPISKRWTKEYKKTIYDSRILTTRAIVNSIGGSNLKPRVLVSASAVGYYGNQDDKIVKEDDISGGDFLAKVCVDWEAEALKASAYGVRVVTIRTANVLGPGGLLSSLYPLFKKGLGGYFGSGKQYMPWIHWQDIVGIYIFALEKDINGPFNVGAGKTITQKDLFKSFGKIIHAPFVWSIPHFFASIAIGEFADALMNSTNTDSEKIINAGYQYKFSDLSKALGDIYK